MIKLKEIVENIDYIRPNSVLVVQQDGGFCDACGGLGRFTYAPIVNDSLAKEWSLNSAMQKAFSARESMFCAFCGCSYRLRALAKAIVLETTSNPAQSLEETIKDTGLQKFSIAEINSCGVLHDILKHAKNLSYSEYGPTDNNVEHQDLSALTYKDGEFDIVLNSDTLEHVPDPIKALEEIYRVLKTGGKHIFTIPMVLSKDTKRRARTQGDIVKHIEPMSFHGSGEPDYLVWNEFGGDFIATIEKVGFKVKLFFQNPLHLEDPSYVIVATKTQTKSKKVIKVDSQYNTTHELEAKKIFSGHKFVHADIQIGYNEQRQIEKVGALTSKLNLSEQHIMNLEGISKAYMEEINKKAAYIELLESAIRKKEQELESLSRSIPFRVHKKIQSVKKKTRASKREQN